MNQIDSPHLVKSGDLCEIRIPQLLLEQASIDQYVEVVIRDGELIIRAAQHPRAGWEEAFRKIGENCDDCLLDEELNLTEWDQNEWVWE